jgi:transcriptional regulator with XRE-family HTH domain
MRTQRLTLEQWRQRYCLSRRELAKKSGVAPNTIRYIEQARHIPIAATRRKLAFALGQVDPAMIAWPVQRAAPSPVS